MDKQASIVYGGVMADKWKGGREMGGDF